MAAQVGSIPGIVTRDETVVLLYIILHPNYSMLIGLELILTVEYTYVPGQVIRGEQSYKGND